MKHRISKTLLLGTLLAIGSCATRMDPLTEAKFDAAENAARMIALTDLPLDDSEASRIRGSASRRSYSFLIGTDARYFFEWDLPSDMTAIVTLSENAGGVNIGSATAKKTAKNR